MKMYLQYTFLLLKLLFAKKIEMKRIKNYVFDTSSLDQEFVSKQKFVTKAKKRSSGNGFQLESCWNDNWSEFFSEIPFES